MRVDRDLVDDMVLWARSRIDHCRRQELKFSAGWEGRSHPPQALIEAWTERRALQAVLGQLGIDSRSIVDALVDTTVASAVGKGRGKK